LSRIGALATDLFYTVAWQLGEYYDTKQQIRASLLEALAQPLVGRTSRG
jgi:hypothetical protein